MSNKIRKGIRSAWLVAALGVVGMLAILATMALPSGSAEANPFLPAAPTGVTATANSAGTAIEVTWTGADTATGYEVERDAGSGYEGVDPAHAGDAASYTDNNVTAGMTYTYQVRSTNGFGSSTWAMSAAVTIPAASTPTPTPPPTATPEPSTIKSSSSTGGSSLKLTLTLTDPGKLNAGSSIALYLEDDFQVGDIDKSKVYFVGAGTGRVYVTDDIIVDDDDHFGGDDDWDLQIFVPDMNPGNDTGFDAWSASSTMGPPVDTGQGRREEPHGGQERRLQSRLHRPRPPASAFPRVLPSRWTTCRSTPRSASAMRTPVAARKSPSPAPASTTGRARKPACGSAQRLTRTG